MLSFAKLNLNTYYSSHVINFGCFGGWFCFGLGALSLHLCVECWAVLAPVICCSIFLALPSSGGFRIIDIVLSIWLCWVVLITKWCWVLLLLVLWDPSSGEVFCAGRRDIWIFAGKKLVLDSSYEQ
ncbi:hypothetical protein KFK09_015571 [Dendrobium nobile]|uniref:Transmembrane protein n=1 Tax=Dendrobium nobile TaxID=94219 RepID=A0A8T3B774_DENNO|nr:hypothetical protein KFK09_015571 [Dendrobium nobile]